LVDPGGDLHRLPGADALQLCALCADQAAASCRAGPDQERDRSLTTWAGATGEWREPWPASSAWMRRAERQPLRPEAAISAKARKAINPNVSESAIAIIEAILPACRRAHPGQLPGEARRGAAVPCC